MKRALRIAVLGLGLLVPAGAGAYSAFGIWEGGDANLFIGNLSYWWASNFADAAREWNSKTDFEFDIQGNGYPACKRYASGVLLRPHLNELQNGVEFADQMCFAEPFDPGVLAVTQYFLGEGGQFLQAGILFNKKDWDWAVYDGPIYESEIDFRRVALHELGHFLGLGHEDTLPSIMSTFVGDVVSLQPDDIEGANSLYGPGAGGGGGAPARLPEVRCRVDQLRAARALCKSELRCEAKHAADPAADAAGAARDACVAGAEAAFATAWDAAVAAGAGACSDESAGASVAPQVAATADGVVAEVGAGDASNPSDRALRANLLRKAAALCAADLGAWKKHAAKPSVARLDAALGAARARFERTGGAAIAKAAARGVVYEGANLPTMVEGVEGLAAQLGTPAAE
jgi:hypothetical protein